MQYAGAFQSKIFPYKRIMRGDEETMMSTCWVARLEGRHIPFVRRQCIGMDGMQGPLPKIHRLKVHPRN